MPVWSLGGKRTDGLIVIMENAGNDATSPDVPVASISWEEKMQMGCIYYIKAEIWP
jgi:hypothetical protein